MTFHVSLKDIDTRRCLRQLLVSAICATGLMACLSANAQTVTFFTSRPAFEATLTSASTLDFEGMVDAGIHQETSGFLLDGVQFTAYPADSNIYTMIVADQHASLPGAPFSSDILLTQDTYGMVVWMPLETNAAGGWFGSVTGPAAGTLEVHVNGSLFSTVPLEMLPLAAGSSEAFLGVLVTGGSLTQLRFNTGQQVGVDNFIYGNGAIAAIPEPSTYSMALAGAFVLGGLAWRRKRSG